MILLTLTLTLIYNSDTELTLTLMLKGGEGESMYLIDDVTKMTGLTKRALRYYEEIGLILPRSAQKEMHGFIPKKR